LFGSAAGGLVPADFATFGEENVYNQQDAVGFINLFGCRSGCGR